MIRTIYETVALTTILIIIGMAYVIALTDAVAVA